MAGTAVVAGTAAASARLGRSGDKLGSALETESRDFLAHFPAVAVWTLDFGLIVEDDLLEVLVAFGAVEFKNRHSRSPFLANYNKGKGGKAIVNPFNDAMSQGTGRIPVLNFYLVVAGYRLLIARLMRVIHRYGWECVTSNE
jgi:hypothetical protein